MYCTACGKALGENDRYCPQCGKANAPGEGGPRFPGQTTRPPLRRAMTNKKIAGVCSGLARHFSMDVTLLRVLFIVGLLLHGLTLLAYVILWIAMPRDDYPMARVQTA